MSRDWVYETYFRAHSPETEEEMFMKRALVAISLPAILALGIIYEYLGGTGMKCVFYEYTGFYCPGCGSGRAVQALFHGQFLRAVRYNILLPLLGLPSFAGLIHEYLRIVFPGWKLKPLRISDFWLRVIIIVLTGFWILRNIPAFYFLAPL